MALEPTSLHGRLVSLIAARLVPSEDLEEEVKAAVQLLDPRDAGPGLQAKLLAYCRQHLAAFKSPRRVDIDAALPRQPTGKPYKQLVRALYWSA